MGRVKSDSTNSKTKFTRRTMMLGMPTALGAAGMSGSLLMPTMAHAISPKSVLQWGALAGTKIPLEFPRTLGWGLYYSDGSRMDGFIAYMNLNGKDYGNLGYKTEAVTTLPTGDYWTYALVRARLDVVTGVILKSARGTVSASGFPYTEPTQTSETQVGTSSMILRIGGYDDGNIRALLLEYVDGFTPSRVVEENVSVVIHLEANSQVITTYEEAKMSLADSYSKVSTKTLATVTKASVEGEYYAKFSASTEIKTTDSTVTSIQSSTQKELTTAKHVVNTISPTQTGLLVTKADIMVSADGDYWVNPKNTSTLTKPDRAYLRDAVRDHYDITGAIQAETGIAPTIKNKYGAIDYYA